MTLKGVREFFPFPTWQVQATKPHNNTLAWLAMNPKQVIAVQYFLLSKALSVSWIA